MELDEILEIAEEEGGYSDDIQRAISCADIETLKEWKCDLEDTIWDIRCRCENEWTTPPEEALSLLPIWAEYECVLKMVKSMIRHGEIRLPNGKNKQATDNQNEVPKSPKRKGRPSNPFKDVIIKQPFENTLKLLHSLIDGKRGKGAIIFLFVAIRYGLITKPTSIQILKEFGDICNKSMIPKYLDLEHSLYTQDEINGVKRALDIKSED